MNPALTGLAALAACALSAPAMAGNYVSLSVGQSKSQDWDTAQLQDGSTISNASAENTDTSLRIALGFGSSENLAFEIAYVDLGEATADGDSDGNGFFWAPGPVSAKAAVDGIELGVVGRIPTSETLDLIAHGGIFLWDLEATLEDNDGTFGGSDDGNDVFFGLGAEFHASPSISFRGEFTRYGVDDIDVDTISFSVISRFGE